MVGDVDESDRPMSALHPETILEDRHGQFETEPAALMARVKSNATLHLSVLDTQILALSHHSPIPLQLNSQIESPILVPIPAPRYRSMCLTTSSRDMGAPIYRHTRESDR